MKILVVGAGAVGGYLGARLVLAGEDVTFVARGEHGRLMSERGLVLHGAREERTGPLRVSEAAALTGSYELILVAVKGDALELACDELPRVIAPHGVVLPLLNGLDSEDVVARYVGAQRTLAAVVYMSGGRSAPGELRVHANTRVGIAAYRPGQDADLSRVAACFERSGVPVRVRDAWQAMLWEKMVWNAPFNALCALTRKSAREALERNPELVREAMEEVLRVARAEEVELPADLPERMMATTRSDFPDAEPSMLQDVRAGRPTEVELLQGAVVERGRRLGIDTPVLRTFAALLRGLA